ncbi:MAG TPA: phage integrase N-terminal SAM-like domain-containing protein [Acidobacteriota bacterium]
MSRQTAQAYVYRIKRFILRHVKRHPSDLGYGEISAFLSHVTVDQRVAASPRSGPQRSGFP